MIRGETLGLEEEGLSCWPGAAREGKEFYSPLCGKSRGRARGTGKVGWRWDREERDCKTVCTPPVFSEEWAAVMNATD